ncbi:PAS domain-containing protein [Streptomyces sp. NBC_00102]|uniref:PAS domain-containing protein n=1 Tax=Streptomyces sp. NBC_00102 TaxID=2975652 RepID=UPI002257592F|nr:PAS domain-containing protein [Streptomyces sp. NBC_00102]MCX5398184.1 PAS domain-containing protein [Streptomyces sp. NBC_00102]
MSSRPSRGTARLAAILDALPDGLLLVNANGTVVNANTIALEMFEAPGTGLVGRGLLDLLAEFDSRLIPGSMRRPDSADSRGRTKPTRMIARRTDGHEFPVEVTSASLDSGQAAYNDFPTSSFTGDELLMLVVRDLSGTVDTEAELARSQRQTEMILRAASEGVVGTDTDGRVVLVNPAAAQILGFRASDLGGKELHPLILHSRAEGEPFPYEESPLADTLRSGRKHRVRGQVLWSKSGVRVPVDLTTAPVRDGDQLVGAVMTFTDRRPYEEQTEQHTTEVAELTEKHAAEIAALTEKHTAQIAELTESHTAEVTELTESHATEVTGLTEGHASEIADRTERYASELEEQADHIALLGAQHAQLTAVLGESLRGPLEELRGELATLASDPAGQLWPEANQILHHLAAGYARMTTLVDNVLGYQRLDFGTEALDKAPAPIDAVVTAGIDGAVELIGPGRAQFAVHAPPIEAEVDARRLATALAHLVADVAGIDSTGKTRIASGGGYLDSTVVVAAAQRGDVVRIEVRGPFAGGDPVHTPIVRGIVRAHGGVLQTHEMPGMAGSAYVLEVPLGAGSGTIQQQPQQQVRAAVPEQAAQPQQEVAAFEAVGAPAVVSGGRRRARRSSTDAFLESATSPEGPESLAGAEGAVPAGTSGAGVPVDPSDGAGATGRRRARRGPAAVEEEQVPEARAPQASEGSGRRRGRPSPAETAPVPAQAGPAQQPVPASQPVPAPQSVPVPAQGGPQQLPAAQARPRGAGQALALPAAGHAASEGSVVTAAEGALGAGRPQRGQTVPPQGVPAGPQQPGAQATGPQVPGQQVPGQQGQPVRPEGAGRPALPVRSPVVHDEGAPQPEALAPELQPAGRRARRALAAAQERLAAENAGPRTPFALGPADADRPEPEPGAVADRHDATAMGPDEDHTPPQPHPVSAAPSGRRRARPAEAAGSPESWSRVDSTGRAGAPGAEDDEDLADEAPQPALAYAARVRDGAGASDGPAHPAGAPAVPLPPAAVAPVPPAAPQAAARPAGPGAVAGDAGPTAHATGSTPVPPAAVPAARRQPLPAELPMPGGSDTQGRAFSVRTLGQGVPLVQHLGHQQNQTLGAAGRRRKLSAPPGAEAPAPAAAPQGLPQAPAAQPVRPGPGATASATGQLMAPVPEGRSYAIGAPDEGAEGPEPLDGPGGAVEIANRPQPVPVDDELPPEPLDNPRRLLVWPAPDVSTQAALSDRGYRPVIVHSREEVDAQIAAFPAALFVDPLTGPITRTALQSLRQAAVAAEVPVLVTAGLGQASRDTAYGADPAVLLKALAPRDSEQHPPRVLVIEEREEIATALAQTLERRGMQTLRASTDSEAVDLAARMRPNLVVMDLMQVRRRRAGIIDWLRANGRLNRTPLVVYTSAGLDGPELELLGSGETALFLAERSTSDEVQSRIVDLLAKIGTN